MKNAIVTGASGFIGRHLVHHLLGHSGAEIYAVVPGELCRLWEGEHRVHVFPCDLEMPLHECLDGIPEGVDVLYHLAWHGVQPEMRGNFQEQLRNVRMARNLMSLAASRRVRRVILPGSTSEYLYNGRPIDGSALPTPADAYGSVKVALRYLCREYALAEGMEFIYVIIAGVYAADRQDNNVIYYTIRNLLQNTKPILTRLEQKWDYVHIDDVTEALLRIGDHGNHDAVYAVGHGDNRPLREYIEAIHKLVAPEVPLGIGEKPYVGGRMPSSCINLAPLARDTGFRPKVDFRQGISEVIAAIRNEMQGSAAHS